MMWCLFGASLVYRSKIPGVQGIESEVAQWWLEDFPRYIYLRRK